MMGDTPPAGVKREGRSDQAADNPAATQHDVEGQHLAHSATEEGVDDQSTDERENLRHV